MIHCVVGKQDGTGNPSLGRGKQLEGIRYHRHLSSSHYTCCCFILAYLAYKIELNDHRRVKLYNIFKWWPILLEVLKLEAE